MFCSTCGHDKSAHGRWCSRKGCSCRAYVEPEVFSTPEGQAALLEDQLESSILGPQHVGRHLKVCTGEIFEIASVTLSSMIRITTKDGGDKWIRDGYTVKDLVPVAEVVRSGARVDVVPALIEQECRELAALLVQKNRSYGNSFANPIGVFAKGLPADAQIRVRIDDKLNRLAKGTDELNEDTIQDLLGYLVLYRVLGKLESK